MDYSDFYDQDLLALTHTGEHKERYMNAVTPPIFLNSLHSFDSYEDYASVDAFADDGFFYGRSGNPTTRILEDKLAALEHGTRAAAFSSGMAASAATIMNCCKAGDHIICMRDIYHPVRRFLEGICIPQLNMTVSYITFTDLDELESCIQSNSSLILLESPATHVFTVVDIPAIAKIAKQHGIRTYIDNSYCTPLYQKPLDMGIDIVMHTMSKYIGGHSDIIGGILVSKDDDLMRNIIGKCREWFGGILGPMEAWLAIRGLRSLDVRLERHQETAMAVAEFLEQHPKIRKVSYTGLKSHPQQALIARQQKGHSGLLSFVPDAAPEKSIELVNRMRLFGKGCSWGGFESLAILPLLNCTQEELNFLQLQESRGLVRIHCGLEGKDNLLNDLSQALEIL